MIREGGGDDRDSGTEAVAGSGDRALLAVAAAQFRLLVESVKDYAIFMLDPTGHVASWNSGAHLIKGYSPEEILGKPVATFYSPEDRAAERPRKLLEIAAREGRVEDEGWRVRKDGTRFWADVVISAVRDASGELIGFAKVTRDLTDRRKMDAERVRLAQAEEAMRLRDEFLSIASHELKTPLTALQLELRALLERIESFEPRTAKKLERASRASDRLADLVESLLDVSRIASGQLLLHYRTFDLSAAAEEVIERLRILADQAECEISFSRSSAVVGNWDRLRIEQVLTNLLSNAFKYAPGTPVAVTVRRDSEHAVLLVRDAGPGFPAVDVAKLFDRFERASPPGLGGLGLGLYVARQVVEAHGGRIAAHNNDGPGACVTVRLPLIQTETPKSAPASNPR